MLTYNSDWKLCSISFLCLIPNLHALILVDSSSQFLADVCIFPFFILVLVLNKDCNFSYNIISVLFVLEKSQYFLTTLTEIFTIFLKFRAIKIGFVAFKGMFYPKNKT